MGSLQDEGSQNQLYRDEHLWVDFRQQVVVLDNHLLTLTRKEYDLLPLLC